MFKKPLNDWYVKVLTQATVKIGLVSAIVDAVDSVPVIAAGGIADGRGLAAATMLGAQGSTYWYSILCLH